MQMIGRLSASAMTNIATTGSSLMNFDFSLVKISAPAELMPLGECLSNKRREKAESGAIHILARRLGALFDGLVQETPNLLIAYGKRASKIAKSLSETQKKPEKTQLGVFSNDAGVDGTTIWAAATSGSMALRLHLLACMLARLWSPQEATAIWVELVEERQEVLREESERCGFIASAAHAAAYIPIEESQLSDWDASARAWILSGDQVMKLQQTQLMLIINNLNLNVDVDNQGVYHSVISVWQRAMTAMENLVSGTGQSVESGAVLLGLSAWHLYPDLLVLGTKTVEIYQKDELVGEGGLLTVGLSSKTSFPEGIHWSLPLASLRYYGGPTYTRRTSGQDSTRLSVPQLQQVAMGALLGHWGNHNIGPDNFAKFIVLLWKLFTNLGVDPVQQDSGGQQTAEVCDLARRGLRTLGGLVKGAQEFLAHAQDAVQRKVALQLMGYGKRHGQRWIGLGMPGEPSISPLFGLTKVETMISLLLPEARVALLRYMIVKFPEWSKTTIIRYKPGKLQPEVQWEFALPLTSMLSCDTAYQLSTRCCTRFVTNHPAHPYEMLSPLFIDEYLSQRSRETCGENFRFTSYYYDKIQEDIEVFALQYEPGDDLCQLQTPFPPYSVSDLKSSCTENESTSHVEFKFVFGDPKLAAVYSHTLPEIHSRGTQFEVDCQQICNLIEITIASLLSGDMTTPGVDIVKLGNHLITAFEASSLGCSLCALAAVSDLYTRYLPDATLSMAFTTTQLKEAKWCMRTLALWRLPSTCSTQIHATLNTTEMFACILQMESGTINADPASLSNVFAISSGFSLFVAGQLLEDPQVELPPDSVVYIVGNIGKGGIALLIPPGKPRMRELELGEWEVIVHAPFDGQKQTGLFSSTTMHLSPTGYELNYDTGTHGLRGRQAFFVETRISVHDKGKWVADVDPLGAFSSLQLQLYKPSKIACTCSEQIPPLEAEMTSIDCWEELLDLPEENEVAVVRASGSWMARIAAVSIAVQRGYCVVLPTNPDVPLCWNCFQQWRTPAHRSARNVDLSGVPLKSSIFVW